MPKIERTVIEVPDRNAEQTRRRAASCDGKERFERAAAERLARETNERNRRKRKGRENPPGVVNAFRCRWCDGWHIGTLRSGA